MIEVDIIGLLIGALNVLVGLYWNREGRPILAAAHLFVGAGCAVMAVMS